MGLKLATKGDIPILMRMAKSFAVHSPYVALVDDHKMEQFILKLIDGDKSSNLLLNHSDVGMLAAMKVPLMFGVVDFGVEFAWWVDEKHREKGIGRELVEAFEFWAKKVGCHATILATVGDDSVGRFYEKLGYVNYERSYYKEI